MRRTSRPHRRIDIKKQDVHLNILEETNTLYLSIKINLLDYDFPQNAKIFLEAYNRLNIDHLDLGTIGSFSEDLIKKRLPSFKIDQRRKINFRLKIVDTTTWKLLGLVEKLKESKYADSLLQIQIDESINSIFKVDCDDIDNPILLINKKLDKLVKDIKPIIAETALKEILFNILHQEDNRDDSSNLENHKWIIFAQKYNPKSNLMGLSDDEKKEWINHVVDEFSKKYKIVDKLKKQLEK